MGHGAIACAVSVRMECLHHVGKVESKMTFRTTAYPEAKAKGGQQHAVEVEDAEGMYVIALQVLCAWLDWDCRT